MIKNIGVRVCQVLACCLLVCCGWTNVYSHTIPINPTSITEQQILNSTDSCISGLLEYNKQYPFNTKLDKFYFDWMMGRLYYRNAEYKQSLDFLLSAFDNDAIKDSINIYYELMEDLGVCELYNTQYESSIEHLSKCYEYYKGKKENTYNLKVVIQEISLNYMMLEDFDSAENFTKDALTIQCSERDMVMFDASLYNSMGRIKGKKKHHKESIDSYLKAIELYESKDRKYYVASVYNNMALEYNFAKDYKNALISAKKSYTLFEQLDNPMGEASVACTMAIVYKDMKLWREAKRYADKVFFIAKKNNYLVLLETYYDIMVDISEQLGNLRQALNYSKKYRQLTENRYHIKKQEYIKKFEATYDKQKVLQRNLELRVEKREKELVLRQKSMERDIFFFLICAFLVVFIVIIRRYILKIKHTDELLIKNDQILHQNRQLEELNHKYIDTNTALYQSKKELEKSKKENDNVFSIITHDLRSPLTSIIGVNQMIIEDYDGMSKEDLKPHLISVFTQVNNLERLLTNLLSWSRVRNGQIKATPKIKYLEEIVDDAYCELVSEIKEKSVRFYFNIDENIEVYIDDRIFNKVLINVMRNALKYSHPKSKVQVYVSSESYNFITLSIKDYGVGIDKKEQFTLFRNDIPVVHHGTKGEKGTGLGLRVCKSFMTILGGDILLESDRNKGTTVMLKLPKNKKKDK
ncbi:tetratricopeptide repeat-containing sensor histidine kinase [Halosquirtibacter xylanolyticus]|uniref:tetratricopeptide repeat-containing sensor histidine kinase n=1 Tax=Halosquirtibacter xylanolyticus TaxID=3374599 RepID=UPI003749807B|nr:tetratricopeptide repeat-containing sensor histidine kinase [Prolixibacteraceae bacterium]